MSIDCPEGEGIAGVSDTYWQHLGTGFILWRQDSEFQILCTTIDGCTRLVPERRTSQQGDLFCLSSLMHQICAIP